MLDVEHAPAGVKAGKAAGCKVLGLATTHDVDRLRIAGADRSVENLTCVKVAGKEERGWMEELDREDFCGQTMTLMNFHATIDEIQRIFHFRATTFVLYLVALNLLVSMKSRAKRIHAKEGSS